MFVDVEDLDDVVVLEPRDRLGLGQEPDTRFGAGVLASQDHLERDKPVEPPLPGSIDDPHAPPAHFGLNLITRDGGQPHGRENPASGRAPIRRRERSGLTLFCSGIGAVAGKRRAGTLIGRCLLDRRPEIIRRSLRNDLRRVRVRIVRQGLPFGCGIVHDDPLNSIGRPAFSAPQRRTLGMILWSGASGRAIISE